MRLWLDGGGCQQAEAAGGHGGEAARAGARRHHTGTPSIFLNF